MTNSVKNNMFIVTQYSLPENKYNMNAYQRNYYGSEFATIHLLIRKKNMVSQELCERVTLHKAPVHNRILFFLYAISLGFRLRFKGVDVVLTEPSKFAWVGFILKYIGGYFWGMDAWDPVWKEHWKINKRMKIIDRLSFWAMGHADLFILSCLPEAVKHIRPKPERSIQLFNAVDLTGIIASNPPEMYRDGDEFHLSLARVRLGIKEGFETILRAAEEIRDSGAKIRIHLVGNLEEDASELLAKSPAKDFFKVHGIIKESRYEFF